MLEEKDWTPQEKWVWNQIKDGEIADLNERETLETRLDPKKSKGWTEDRVLRPEFLTTLLTDDSYTKGISHTGITIQGAWFSQTLNLQGMTLNFPLGLVHSRFDGDVYFNRLRVKVFSLQGSKFTKPLSMNALQVEDHLFMGDKAEFAEVDLGGAKIGGQFDMENSHFTGKLNMNGLQVEGSLLMRGEAEFAEVDLTSAKISGQLDLKNSRFTEVVLAGAKIGDQLDMSGSRFTGELIMDSISVGQHVFFRNTHIDSTDLINMVYSEIGGGLVIGCQSMPALDLTGAKIKGELLVGGSKPIHWKDKSKLILKNVSAGSLNDHRDSWPAEIDLRGFKYAGLGGVESGGSDPIENRDEKWFKEWLARQTPYAPQPYRQLAAVLKIQGHEDKAKEILYAGKEREREGSKGWRKVSLVLQWLLIGYGHRIYYSAICFLGLIFLGMLVLCWSGEGIAHGMPVGFSYSLDMLLPIIQLRPWHYSFDLQGCARYYFYFHKIMGYVLGLYLIAGLSGLIDREK